MAKRETYKDIELQGRKWRIRKFDAQTGSFIAMQLLTRVLPMGMDAKLGVPLPAGRGSMSKQEFMELQRECLAVCYELIDAGEQQAPIAVIRDDGSFGVADMQNNTMLAIMLTIHALVFNVTGFFEGDALKELQQSLGDLPLFNANT